MTSKQKLKQLLTTNPELIQLLNDENWTELLNKLPVQTRPVLLELLRDIGLEEKELEELQKEIGIMYGLKFSSSTVTIGAPDKDGIHNVGNVSNQGMQGGRMLGFKTVEAAQHVASQIGNPRVYTMNPATAKNYTWIKVNTIHGPAYAALEAIGKFKNLDKTLKEKSQAIIDLQNTISRSKSLLDDPEYSDEVRKAAGKENVKNLRTVCETIENAFAERGVDIKFYYPRATLDEYCADVELRPSYNCYLRYEMDIKEEGEERLEDGFFKKLKESILRKLPHLTSIDLYKFSGDKILSVSFPCTYESPEAKRAKQEVIRQAEQTIATSIPQLKKLKAELA